MTLVLAGAKTWRRRHVGWEICASLRHTGFSPSSGLFGLLSPIHPDLPSRPGYDPYTIPPGRTTTSRAARRAPRVDGEQVARLIEDAGKGKSELHPDNSPKP